MVVRIKTIVVVLCLVLVGSVAMADEVRIATGQTFIKNIFDPIRTPFKERTGLEIKISVGGPVPSIADLEKGTVDAAGASLPLSDWLRTAREANVQVRDESAYTTYVPITEQVRVIVNSSNKVKGLTTEQIRGIFSGRIQNWKEVGGDDLPILVVWPSISSGALVTFESKIMNKEPVTKTVFDVPSIDEVVSAVAGSPESIGVTGVRFKDERVKDVMAPLERPLTLVYVGKPSPALQKLLEFLKSEGPKYYKM